eukprot:3030950-Prymnesium_polylepis.4
MKRSRRRRAERGEFGSFARAGAGRPACASLRRARRTLYASGGDAPQPRVSQDVTFLQTC